MVKFIKSFRWYDWGFAALSLGVAALVILYPRILPFPIVKFTAQAMLIFFFLGMLFLLFSQERLMVVSLVTTMILCVFLKRSFSSDLFGIGYSKPIAETPSLIVANFNYSAFQGMSRKTITNTLIKTEADILSIQEIIPTWNQGIDSVLATYYPYSIEMVRIDLYGQAIYSKHPFTFVDTFYYNSIPALFGAVEHNGSQQDIGFMSLHLDPIIGERGMKEARNHLDSAAYCLNKTYATKPVFVFGELNLVPWEGAVQAFRTAAKLEDSRRDFSGGLLQVPNDHIFFPPTFNCLGFSAVGSNGSDHLGIKGKYQYSK